MAGHLGKGRALRRLAASAALHRGRVDEQQLVARVAAAGGEHARELFDRVGEATTALAVTGLVGRRGEQVPESLLRRRQEAALARDAHDRLGDAERDHLGVGDPAPRVTLGGWQEIVACATSDRAESVEVGVPRGLRADGDVSIVGFGLSALLSLGTVRCVESII